MYKILTVWILLTPIRELGIKRNNKDKTVDGDIKHSLISSYLSSQTRRLKNISRSVELYRSGDSHLVREIIGFSFSSSASSPGSFSALLPSSSSSSSPCFLISCPSFCSSALFQLGPLFKHVYASSFCAPPPHYNPPCCSTSSSSSSYFLLGSNDFSGVGFEDGRNEKGEESSGKGKGDAAMKGNKKMGNAGRDSGKIRRKQRKEDKTICLPCHLFLSGRKHIIVVFGRGIL